MIRMTWLEKVGEESKEPKHQTRRYTTIASISKALTQPHSGVGITWVDFDAADSDVLELLQNSFFAENGICRSCLQELQSENSHSRLTLKDSAIVIRLVTHFITEDGKLESSVIAAVLSNACLLTLRLTSSPYVAGQCNSLFESTDAASERTASLLSKIASSLEDDYSHLLDTFEGRVQALSAYHAGYQLRDSIHVLHFLHTVWSRSSKLVVLGYQISLLAEDEQIRKDRTAVERQLSGRPQWIYFRDARRIASIIKDEKVFWDSFASSQERIVNALSNLQELIKWSVEIQGAVEESNVNISLARLTWLAAFATPVFFVFAYFGMTFEELKRLGVDNAAPLATICMLIAYVIYLVVIWNKGKNGRR